jgi:hypothetical protein
MGRVLAYLDLKISLILNLLDGLMGDEFVAKGSLM